jgi:hypothetical protein
MRRWQKRNRKKVRTYNAAWRAANPEKVKAQKKRAAPKYKIRRRMLYETRSPERIKQDNAKALKAYHRRYPNRSPEQVERDTERRREKYRLEREELERLRVQVKEGKAAAAILKKIEEGKEPIPIGADRIIGHKPGPTPEDDRAAYICDLYKQRLSWDAIKKKSEEKFGVYGSADAHRMLRIRFLHRQQKRTN